MSRLTHSSDGPQEDKKARLDQLLRELDALLSEDEEDPDDPGTIDDIERKSEEGAQRIRRLIAEKLLEKKQRFARGQSAAQPWLCSCGQVSRYVGRRPRQILLRSGCHTITRAYYYCASCQQGICPLDTGLQLCPGQCSPRLAATLARLSAYLPDRKVVQELNHFWGIEVAVSTAQRYSRRVGASIAAEWQSNQVKFREQRLPESRRHPKRLHVSMDGVQIHVDGDWHEAKVGVVYELDSRGHAAHSRFTATLETSREFGPRLVVLAHQAGSDHCRDLAVVADGGPWIWQETGKYFPGSVQALDYYHASGHLWAAARSRYGEGTSAAGDWAKTLKDLMYKQKQEQLIQEIRSWQPKTEAKRTVRRRLLNYLQEHRNRMAYKTLKEQSYHIGSGVVEASCKNVVQSRMKQAGMRWSSSGAEAILHTCSHFHSEGNTDFRQYV